MAAASRANLTFQRRRFAGDGLANVGSINSTGHDLGKVTVKGDLGQTTLATRRPRRRGFDSSVRSLGRLGTDTQGASGDLESHIISSARLEVAGDVKDAFVRVTGGADGKIGAIKICCSLLGGSLRDSGEIFSSRDIGV